MGLDICVLGNDGRPERMVSFNPDEHYELMQVVQALSAGLLKRIASYYEDVEFMPDEVPLLRQEVMVIKAVVLSDALLVRILQLEELIEYAIRLRSGIEALAD